MAKIGAFGSMVFSVSENTVKTFDQIGWDKSIKYTTHDRHIKRDVLEFLGPEPDGISFQMVFSVFHGTNPLQELKKLHQLADNGIVERLVLGGKVYGSYKWAITKVSGTLKRYDNNGNCWAVVAKVTLKEYPKR